jgi:hypothetical protein
MRCYNETSAKIQEIVNKAIEVRSENYAIGMLIGYLTIILAYDVTDEKYELNMRAFEKHLAHLTQRNEDATNSPA